jgi:enoyl-CoA hydratase/carnithine racemase
MLENPDAAVREASRDLAIKVVVLRGAGRAFCAGFDFGQEFSSGYGTALYTDGRWDPGKDMIGTTSGRKAEPVDEELEKLKANPCGRRTPCRFMQTPHS